MPLVARRRQVRLRPPVPDSTSRGPGARLESAMRLRAPLIQARLHSRDTILEGTWPRALSSTSNERWLGPSPVLEKSLRVVDTYT